MNHLFSILPLWLIYSLFVLLMIISIKGGMNFYRWRKKRIEHEDDSSINTLVGATLGLLAFILAFTFNLSSSRFDARKHFFLEEVNSIETSWLRAGLIQSPYKEQLQKELVDYTEIRIWGNNNPNKIKEAIEKSQAIQNTIWSIITNMTIENNGNDKINSLLINAVNDMFDNQTRRISIGLIDRIPNLIWLALFGLTIIAMFEVGYLLGKTEKANWVLVFALSMSFSAIVLLIVDLDSSKGHITINNQALYDMYNRIK